MNFDLTITVSVIFGTIAIVSPILTSLINNKFQLKLRKLELLELNKKQIVIDFTSSALKSFYADFPMDEFYKNLNAVILYLDNDYSKVIGEIKYLVENKASLKDLNSALMKLTISISQDSKKPQ